MNASSKVHDRFLSNKGASTQHGLERVFEVLEGPGVMRTVSAAAGIALVVGTALDVLASKKRNLVLEMPSLVLRAYVIVFGLTIALNEMKSMNIPSLEQWRDFVFKWMPFLSVTFGKGLFMILTSSVGLAFQSSILVWAPSMAVCAVGFVYCIFYFYDRKEQDAAITASMSYSAVPGGGNNSLFV